MNGKTFSPGEVCLLLDTRGRRYLVKLEAGGEFQYHAGTVPHAEIIGAQEGSTFRSSSDARLIALRPRLADYILRMKRGPQVVYPKDVGPILVWGDIGPGMTVVEAGTGSGALTMALIRAVGPSGRVISIDRREDHAAGAAEAIATLFGEIPANLDLRVGEAADVIVEVGPERIVLDLPDPKDLVAAAAEGLVLGGVISAYVPTVPQVQRFREALVASGSFADLYSFEVLHREWVADGRSVRPEHQMVGHTGFITVARRSQGTDSSS